MQINHTKMHYVIGGLALALAGGAIVEHPVQREAAIHQVQKPSRFDWASLGQDGTTALGEALKGVSPGKVTIFCNAASCHDLALDLDDAFQIAEWKSEFQPDLVESEEDKGIFVGPPGDDANKLAEIIRNKTGMDPKIVGITDVTGKNIDGLGVIIGKVLR